MSIGGDRWDIVTAGRKARARKIGKWRKTKKEKHKSRKRERQTEEKEERKKEIERQINEQINK